MAVTRQFLLGPMVNAVPSSARGCRKAGLIRLSLGPLTCPQGTASLPVPKQAPDSPNQINRNSTSVNTSTTHGHLQEVCEEDCPVAVAGNHGPLTYSLHVCLLSRYI